MNDDDMLQGDKELLLSLLTEHELDESCLHCKRKTGPECDGKSGSNLFAKKVFFNFLRSGSDCSLPCTHRAPSLYPVRDEAGIQEVVCALLTVPSLYPVRDEDVRCKMY